MHAKVVIKKRCQKKGPKVCAHVSKVRSGQVRSGPVRVSRESSIANKQLVYPGKGGGRGYIESR